MGLFDDFDPSVDYITPLKGSSEQSQGSFDFNTSRQFQGEGYQEEWSWNPLERIKASTEESIGSIFGMGAALAQTVGWDSARDWAIERSSNFFESAADRDIVKTDFSSIRNPLDAAKWAAETITSYAPDLVMMFAGGLGAGTALGKAGATAAGKKTVEVMMKKGFQKNLDNIMAEAGAKEATEEMMKAAAKQTARDAGALLGVSSFEGSLGAGQSFLTDVEKRGAEDASGAAALASGAAQSLVALFNPVNKVLAGKLPKGKTNILQMTIGEASEEAGQEVVSMAHEAGIDPELTFGDIISSPEGRMRLLESGIAGALLGTTFGGGLRATFGRKDEEKKGTTEEVKTPTWEENLKKIREKEVIIKEPDKVLEAKGIDTSQDAKVPEMFREMAEEDAIPPPAATGAGTLARDIPSVTPEEPLGYEPTDLPPAMRARLDEEARIQREAQNREDAAEEAEYQSERDTLKTKGDTSKIANKNLIEEYMKDERFQEDSNTLRAGEDFVINPKTQSQTGTIPTKTTKLKQTVEANKLTKAEKKAQEKEAKVKEADALAKSKALYGPKVSQGTALKPEEQTKKETKEMMTSTTPVTDVGEARVSERETAGMAEQQRILESIKAENTTKEGWTAESAEVDGNRIKKYTKDNHTIVQQTPKKLILASIEDGVRVNKGTFKTIEDAIKATETGETSNEFYKKKQTRAYQEGISKKLTPEQAKALSEIDVYQTAQRAAAKMKITDVDAIEMAVDAIYKGASRWTKGRTSKKTGKPISMKSYVWNYASGAIKDYYKDPTNIQADRVSISKEGTSNEGSERGDALENIAETEALEAATDKSPRDKEKKRGRKTKEEQAKADAEKKQKEAEAKEKASEVKKVSVEEYLKEKKAQEEKDAAEKKRKAEAAKKVQVKEEAPKEREPVRAEVKDQKDSKKEVKDKAPNKELEDLIVDNFDTARDTDVTTKLKNLGVKKFVLETSRDLKDTWNLLERILPEDVLESVRVEVYNMPDPTGRGTIGHYDMNSNSVKMYSYNYRGEPIARENLAATLVHEIVHAITHDALQFEPDIKKELDELRDGLAKKMLTSKQYEIFKAHNNDPHSFNKWRAERVRAGDNMAEHDLSDVNDARFIYMLLSNDELLANATHPEMKARLNRVKISKARSEIVKFMNRVKEILRDLLGLTKKDFTAFEYVMGTIGRLNEPIEFDYEASLAEVDQIQNNQLSGLSVEEDKKPEAKKTWDDRAKIMLENDVRMKPLQRFKRWKERAIDTMKDIGKGMTEVVREIAPELLRPIRKMEQGINNKNVEYQKRVRPFIEGYRKLSAEDKVVLDLSLMNRHHDEYKRKGDEVLQRNNLTTAFRDVEGVLEEIHFEKGKVGLNHYKDIPNYFPRRVERVRELMQYIKNDPDYGVIKAEIDSLGKDASEKDKEEAISRLINTGRFPAIALLDPTSSKKRLIDKVSSEWVQFYNNTEAALINHIYESNEHIYTRKFFGDVNRKKLVAERDKIMEQLEENRVKDRKGKVARLKEIEDYLNNWDKEFTDGISDLLLKRAPNLSAQDQDTIVRAIRARLMQKGMTGAAASVRNFALMSALASPTSAITQLGDLAFSVYRSGIGNTVKSILGKKMITAEDLDLSNSMKEFQSEGSAKWLDRTLKWSGLKYMDQFGKNTTMNSAINRAKKMSKEEFTKEFSYILQEDTEQTYNDIKEGKNTDLTRFFAFNEISDFQPVSLSEMPIKYLTAGNGRIFYALKSYNIKALNTVYRESVYKYRTATTTKERLQAGKNLGKLLMLMTFAGAGADELKDFLLGKDAGTFEDNVHENLLKIFMMSRYSMDKGFKSGDPVEVLLSDLLIPPTGLIADPFKDVRSLITKGEFDFRTINNLPWGKIPYAWLSSAEESRDMANLREEILNEIKSGASISSVNKRKDKYNEWVNKEKPEGVNPLNYGSLTRARKEYLKNR